MFPQHLSMEKNVGETDRLVRIGIGAVSGAASLAILGGAIETNELLAPVLGVASLALLGTAYTSKCGLYNALGINTSE